MEQGTGKTPVEINDAARRWGQGHLDALLVLAPNGVHTNWTLREIPKHLPSWVEHVSAAWTSGPNKREAAALDDLFSLEHRGKLRILTMNWEAISASEAAQAFALKFIRSLGRVKLVADESHRIKNPKAGCTKFAMKLKPYSEVRSIDTGTPIANSPWDAFSQFGFLDFDILGTTSYYAFKAEYAELLPPGHGLLRHIKQRNPEARFDPQVVARDPITGKPKWKNLDKLNRLIAPHSFRRLKSECLDLPTKIYSQRFFRMTAKQQKAYDLLRDELRLQLEDGTISPVQRIAAITKLSQVTSGYFIVPGSEGAVQRIMPLEKNPKIAITVEEVAEAVEEGQQVIVWAHFRQEIEDIATVLGRTKVGEGSAARYIKVVQYHGGVKGKVARNAAIDDFESGHAQVMVAQQAAGGTGLTLIAKASMARKMLVIYHSNTYSLTDRLQSEDRAHRIGQEKSVTYKDILAENSIDLGMVETLRNKQDVASVVTGDQFRTIISRIGYGHG